MKDMEESKYYSKNCNVLNIDDYKIYEIGFISEEE